MHGNCRRNNNGKESNGKDKKGPIPSKFVDGKKVEGRFYSKEEFGKMTKAQRAAVIELKKKRRSPNDSDKDTQISQVTLDDMITLGDAIVAGVKRASVTNDEGDDPASTNDDQTQAGRVTATSGSVGTAFRNRKKSKQELTT